MAFNTLKDYGDVPSASYKEPVIKVTMDEVTSSRQAERRISIRAYFKGRDDNFYPTSKGCMIPADPMAIDQMIDALTAAKNDLVAEMAATVANYSVATVGKENVAIVRRQVTAAKARKEAAPVKKTVTVKKAAARRR